MHFIERTFMNFCRTLIKIFWPYLLVKEMTRTFYASKKVQTKINKKDFECEYGECPQH